ncbi:Gfo/Idh/MocA family oxidoreductase [Solibacillus sp. R5-41]|uniref:Gfo/Idh/MocA family oxidoreductase n=1 Tax=Solibacillus sp. R5-41 TaxID=2048654 RepID=UPI0012FE746B|nr:Gfo/Idh/MocA family oxidoreductase [Solibacillus sp. R5-41]
MVTKIGLIGLSEGNGHPYSFSSIINGYNDKFLEESGWDVIHNYVKKRDISEFGLGNARITHVWTQDLNISQNIARACNIKNVVTSYQEMLGEIDALIIARDDFENHYQMAIDFLEADIKVFIDKPLTCSIKELKLFKKYLLKGQLMSVAGLRFAMELDDVRSNINTFGKLKFIQSSVIMNWEKYGIHIIDAVLGTLDDKPFSIEYIKSDAQFYLVHFESGLVWTINVLGSVPKTFNIEFWGEENRRSVEIEDNFTMFRRMLYRFVQMVEHGEVLHKPEDTILSIALLIAGNKSEIENRKVYLKEVIDEL